MLELTANLLSVNQMTEKGYIVTFDNKGCKVYNEDNFSAKGQIKFTRTKKNDLYTTGKYEQEPVTALTAAMSEQELWHMRLGHLYRKV